MFSLITVSKKYFLIFLNDKYYYLVESNIKYFLMKINHYGISLLDPDFHNIFFTIRFSKNYLHIDYATYYDN